jgi:hypothetical protein
MIKITDLFKPEELKEKSDGNFIVTCPSCNSDNTNYGGMVLFVDTNTAYCYNSRKWFTLLELVALKKGIIKCIDGRDSNE